MAVVESADDHGNDQSATIHVRDEIQQDRWDNTSKKARELHFGARWR
jgi:hypothetical protein